jgi:hypothetical protein
MPKSIALEKGVGLHHKLFPIADTDHTALIAPASRKMTDFDPLLRKSG